MSKKSGWGGLEKSPGVGVDKPKSGEIIQSNSVAVNWLFGSHFGLPRGYSAVLWGPPRSSKTVMCWDFVANLHKQNPNARAVWFDTEMRVGLQSGGATSKNVDWERVLVKSTNVPSEIFDFIEKDVADAIDSGVDIQLIVIDSLSMIRGRRSLSNASIDNMTIGDQALTLQEGFSRILPTLRRKKIALLCTAQARAEMDQYQQMLKKTQKMSVSFGVKHAIEFFIKMSQVENKDGKVFDDTKSDIKNNSLLIGQKMTAVMEESSAGGKGRVAQFTLDYEHGIVNVGSEVAILAKNLQIIQKVEGSHSYTFEDQKWHGFAAVEKALNEDLALRDRVVAEIKRQNQRVEVV